MTMRNKLWTTIGGSTNVAAGGPSGQIGTKVGDSLLVGLGISHLAGWTIGPCFLDLLIHNDDGNAGAVTARGHVGIMIGQGGLDNGDFPDLSVGDGDYFLRHSMVFDGGRIGERPGRPAGGVRQTLPIPFVTAS